MNESADVKGYVNLTNPDGSRHKGPIFHPETGEKAIRLTRPLDNSEVITLPGEKGLIVRDDEGDAAILEENPRKLRSDQSGHTTYKDSRTSI